MGYLIDNTPPGRSDVLCHDIYPLRLIVEPRFASDTELGMIVKDVLPDVEDWQFSGRKYRPLDRVVNATGYAHNSQKLRPYDERVIFAFHSTADRQAVAARFTSRGYKFVVVDEP